MNRSHVGQTFLSAGPGGFPAALAMARLECRTNRRAGKPALRPVDGPNTGAKTEGGFSGNRT